MRGFTPKGVSQALRNPPPEPPAPPPPPRQVQVHVNVGHVFGAARWAWGAYTSHRDGLAREEQTILELAHSNYGWLTEIQVIEALGYSARKTQACLERLTEAQMCHAVAGRLGVTVYVFPQFLPLMVCCGYCDSDFMAEVYKNCPNCGAPSNPTPLA